MAGSPASSAVDTWIGRPLTALVPSVASARQTVKASRYICPYDWSGPDSEVTRPTLIGSPVAPALAPPDPAVVPAAVEGSADDEPGLPQADSISPAARVTCNSPPGTLRADGRHEAGAGARRDIYV